MADEARGYYGLQFHAEVTHTKQGARIYSRFVHEICGCGDAWKPDSIIDDAIARVRAQVGDGHVLLGLSGGVDSSGLAVLQHKEIGPQLYCGCCAHDRMHNNKASKTMTIVTNTSPEDVIHLLADEEDPD